MPCDDPQLGAVVRSWAHLPEAVRAGIVAMVQAAKPKDQQKPEH